MSVSPELPKWPIPPSPPSLPVASSSFAATIPVLGLGFFVPALRPGAVSIAMTIKRVIDEVTLPERKAKHARLMNDWAKRVKPVQILHAGSHRELELAVRRFRDGEVSPGSQIIVGGTYAEKIIITHDAFCKHFAGQRDERLKLFGHIVKLAALTTSVAAGPVGSSAQAAAYAFVASLSLSINNRDSECEGETEVEIKHITEFYDLIEVAVSFMGGMTHSRWNDRRLMAMVSAKLVKELLYNGAVFTDNDGESVLIKWGEVIGQKSISPH